MHNVKLEIAETLNIESRGRMVTLDVSKLDPKVIAYAALHGLKQKIADSAASAASVTCGAEWADMNRADKKVWVEANAKKIADNAQAMMEDAVTRLMEGEWEAQRQGGGGTPADPVVALALKNAKSDLTNIFKVVTGAKKIADMAAHEKVAPYFNESPHGHVWNNAKVAEWIEAQAEAGKRDYMADAKATLTVDVDSIDI